jgi:hypothetical protein
MSRPSPLLLGIAALLCAAGTASPVTATKRCPPLPVSDSNACKCTVHNYGTTDDTGISFTVYLDGASDKTCGPVTVAPGLRASCVSDDADGSGTCACLVTGEAATTRASLHSDPGGTVECR